MLQLMSKIADSSIWKQFNRFGILRRTLGHLTMAIDDVADENEKYLTADEIINKYLHISRFNRFMRKIMSTILTKLNISTRMSAMDMYWHNVAKELKGCRKWCLTTFVSRRFTMVQYWLLLFNLVPIAGEITLIFLERGVKYTKKDLETEVIVFEVINGILALVYIFDAIIGIVGLNCRTYFKDLGNITDFLVTLAAFCQIIIGIVFVSAYRQSESFTIIYVLVTLGLFRLIRLGRILLTGVFQTIMDETCSIIYNAYDLAIGFVVANEEIARIATKLVNYEPSADLAQFTAENNILQMLSRVDDLEQKYSDVVNAWKTHTATVYVLRDMENVIKEMRECFMLDESDADILLESLDLKIKDTLCAPRYMPMEQGMRHILKNVLWVVNDNMLDMLLDNYSISSYLVGETVQESDKKHEDVKLVSSGIIQLVNISYERLQKMEELFGDLSFVMWKPIALEIAQNILIQEENYEYWSEERIKIHLEEGIFPDLIKAVEFEVHPAIADMVLIQGRVKDAETDVDYVGPVYIPGNVRHLTLIDDSHTRPRVIIVLLREEKFHSRTISGWIDPRNITYKGLCLVHGMRRASIASAEELNEALGLRTPPNFIQTMGHLFNPKGVNLPHTDVP